MWSRELTGQPTKQGKIRVFSKHSGVLSGEVEGNAWKGLDLGLDAAD